jgi:hypothetical protein
MTVMMEELLVSDDAWISEARCRSVTLGGHLTPIEMDDFHFGQDDDKVRRTRRESAQAEARAKRLCNGDPDLLMGPCPVRYECLQSALRNREGDGVWGGLNPNERDIILIRRGERPVRTLP